MTAANQRAIPDDGAEEKTKRVGSMNDTKLWIA
jgi:hypothetical protein